jgi:hypothetical protein
MKIYYKYDLIMQKGRLVLHPSFYLGNEIRIHGKKILDPDKDPV